MSKYENIMYIFTLKYFLPVSHIGLGAPSFLGLELFCTRINTC